MRRPAGDARPRSRVFSGAGAIALLLLAPVAIAGDATRSDMGPSFATTRSAVAGAAASLVPSTESTVAVEPSPAPPPSANDLPSVGETPRPDPASARPAVLGRSTPERLRIDAIGVDTDLVGLGLKDDGTMQVPAGAFPAGWYRGAPTPGELGPAIIVGHVDWAGTQGVFADLDALDAGDEVAVSRGDGTTAMFTVTHVERVAKHAFPTTAVYGDLDHAGLRLITCGGVFDQAAGSYEDNVIVYAELDGVAGNDGDVPYTSSVGSPPS